MTATEINALPPKAREYIHQLEVNTDPSGMVRENMQLLDTNKGSNDNWIPGYAPSFNTFGLEYYVGHEPPPIKRTTTLTVNGRGWVLPEPLKGPFHEGRTYYTVSAAGRPSLRVWENTDADKLRQSKLRMHATEAECQAWADFDKWCREGGI